MTDTFDNKFQLNTKRVYCILRNRYKFVIIEEKWYQRNLKEYKCRHLWTRTSRRFLPVSSSTTTVLHRWLPPRSVFTTRYHPRVNKPRPTDQYQKPTLRTNSEQPSGFHETQRSRDRRTLYIILPVKVQGILLRESSFSNNILWNDSLRPPLEKLTGEIISKLLSPLNPFQRALPRRSYPVPGEERVTSGPEGTGGGDVGTQGGGEGWKRVVTVEGDWGGKCVGGGGRN